MQTENKNQNEAVQLPRLVKKHINSEIAVDSEVKKSEVITLKNDDQINNEEEEEIKKTIRLNKPRRSSATIEQIDMKQLMKASSSFLPANEEEQVEDESDANLNEPLFCSKIQPVILVEEVKYSFQNEEPILEKIENDVKVDQEQEIIAEVIEDGTEEKKGLEDEEIEEALEKNSYENGEEVSMSTHHDDETKAEVNEGNKDELEERKEEDDYDDEKSDSFDDCLISSDRDFISSNKNLTRTGSLSIPPSKYAFNQTRELENIFELFDFDRDKLLNKDDFKKIFEALRIKDTQDESIKNFILNGTYDESNEMNLDQFVNFFGGAYYGRYTLRELKYAFNTLDRDNDGFITFEDLNSIYTELGWNKNYNVKSVFDKLDWRHVGKIDFNNFKYFMVETQNFQ